LVVFHGYGFNGHIFHRLLPIAASSHIRLVVVNRRGYAGSTPFKPEDTDPFDPSGPELEDETGSAVPRSPRTMAELYTTFLQQRGAEVARFLQKFIEIEKIPPKSEEGGRAMGGICRLGWSLGNVVTLSMLAFANTYDPALMKQLEPYLRKVVIYDPPHHALGYPTPKDTYNPLFDQALPIHERHLRFSEWVSSYYSHSSAILDPKTSVDSLLNGLLEQRNGKSSKSPTITNLPAEDIAKGLETITPGHADAFLLLDQARPVHKHVRIRAIFGNYNQGNSPFVLPNTGISYIWATESVWETVFAMKSLEADVVNPASYYYLARPVKFFALQGGNHYMHWDDPLKALATFSQAVE